MSDALLPVRFANLFRPGKRCWVLGLRVYCRLLKLWSFDCDPIQLQEYRFESIVIHFVSVFHNASLARLGPDGDEAERRLYLRDGPLS
jgi:hypothetical protein